MRLTPAITLEDRTANNGIAAALIRAHVEDWCSALMDWVYGWPNTPDLWAQIVKDLSGHLCVLWASGMLHGKTRKEAFFVTCDRSTMTTTDIENGLVICDIGVVPEQSAEFVVFRLQIELQHRSGSCEKGIRPLDTAR